MPKTRKLKGIELSGHVLVLIIVVAVVIALWWVISGMLASANAPNIQIDPYNSTIVGNQVWLTVKFGTAAQGPRVEIYDPSGTTNTPTRICGPVSGPQYVSPGDTATFVLSGCTLRRGRPYIVVVTYEAGGKTYRQTLNWQP